MSLSIFNTLSRQKEIFSPIKPGEVSMYTCGPTVYNHLHIGNWRAYVFADLLKRHLLYSGYQVKHVMNITDVEDKIIREVQAQNRSLKDLTEFYTEQFYLDRDLLNILPADKYPKATEYINEMVTLIEKLLERGFAYKSDDDSVYFDLKKDADYGKLSHFKLADLKENADERLSKDEYDKENAQDFALWKAWTPDDGQVFWQTTFGKGRPGWHIECSAMSMKELGQSFDLHTGGVDNIFPHHENEIAQSECATGVTFAKYFMHNEHLMVDGQKMSKSLGNFYKLEDLQTKGLEPLAFRYWLYTSSYTTRTNFTLEAALGSQTALNRLRESYKELGVEIGQVNLSYQARFKELLDNNLDSPRALALIYELLKDKEIADENKKATLLDFDQVLGFNLAQIINEIIPEEVLQLANERQQARIEKNWTRSDELRKEINDLGYEVKDTENGPEISHS